MNPLLSKTKAALLKAVDLSALTFLEPVVRLAYGEEPAVQLRRIGRTILVPVIAVGIFLGAWSLIAGLIQTKAGTLPDPAATWTQGQAIWTGHVREGEKQTAYDLTGPRRERQLARVEARLEELTELDTQAREQVAAAEARKAEVLDETRTPLLAQIDRAKADIKKTKAERKEELKAAAVALEAGDRAAYDAYLVSLESGGETIEKMEEKLDALELKVDEAESRVYAPLIAAQKQATAIAEEIQHLNSMKDLLGDRNRGEKLTALDEKLEAQTAAFYDAQGEAVYSAANRIERTQRQITRTEEANYPMPYTLPWQVVRSIMCVFVGFILGTAVAVPIGVLCGLSPTIMAAMTPFIALFKPVSPIVWLPIMLIIVSGLVGDPDNNAFIQLLWELPLIGGFEINPAFLASAAVVALCSLWATLANTALGVASIDQDHINVARVLKLGFWSRLFKIVLPSALPLMFAGMRISLGVGWMVLIAAELLASSEGIGKFVIDMFNNGSSDSFAALFVVVFVVGIIGLFLDRIMIIFQRLVSFDGSVASI
ncbi:MAG: ABC transporter permease subunit [Planctomycetota bacterium]